MGVIRTISQIVAAWCIKNVFLQKDGLFFCICILIVFAFAWLFFYLYSDCFCIWILIVFVFEFWLFLFVFWLFLYLHFDCFGICIFIVFVFALGLFLYLFFFYICTMKTIFKLFWKSSPKSLSHLCTRREHCSQCFAHIVCSVLAFW